MFQARFHRGLHGGHRRDAGVVRCPGPAAGRATECHGKPARNLRDGRQQLPILVAFLTSDPLLDPSLLADWQASTHPATVASHGDRGSGGD